MSDRQSPTSWEIDVEKDACRDPEGCDETELVGEDRCRRHYMRLWRARKRNGETPRTYRGVEVSCRRDDCLEMVHITGKRRKAYEEKGTLPYHSRECQKLDKVVVTCEGCGKAGERYRSEVARNKTGRFFLHKECMYEVGAKPRRGTVHACEGCGAEFYRRPGDQAARFHSKACRTSFESKQRVTLFCEGCGNSFEVIKAVADRGRKYHDNKCRYLAQITNRVPGQWHNDKPKRYEQNGYVLIWEPDRPVTYHGWVFEHRYVMEEHLGRFLTREEEVDHINEVKTDNRLENLRVLSRSGHASVTGKSNWRKRKAIEAELEEYRRRFGPLSGETP